jgi:hypothetical protein
MDIKKFVERGQGAQTAVNKILSEAEVAMIRRGNKEAHASDQERVGRAIAKADHEAAQLPAAGAPLPELLASIDQAVAVLRKYPNSADLQYCVGYLEGFRELLTGSRSETKPKCGCRADWTCHLHRAPA